MQLLDYLELKNQTISDFAVEVDKVVSTVWRHAHGKTRPEPEDIEAYDRLTKGAVTAQDWHELALRVKRGEETPDAADQTAATG